MATPPDPAGPAAGNPVPASALHARMRLEVRAFVAGAGTRRRLPVTCHVGHPGASSTRLVDEESWDAGLRADLVERAVDSLLETAGACAWLTRAGDLGTVDADPRWHAAARTGFSRHGLELPAFYVVNRTGWLDLVSGAHRRWSRVRLRG